MRTFSLEKHVARLFDKKDGTVYIYEVGMRKERHISVQDEKPRTSEVFLIAFVNASYSIFS